jgi:hypothetical protein
VARRSGARSPSTTRTGSGRSAPCLSGREGPVRQAASARGHKATGLVTLLRKKRRGSSDWPTSLPGVAVIGSRIGSRWRWSSSPEAGGNPIAQSATPGTSVTDPHISCVQFVRRDASDPSMWPNIPPVSILQRYIRHHRRSDLFGYLTGPLRVRVELLRLVGDRDALSLRRLNSNATTR